MKLNLISLYRDEESEESEDSKKNEVVTALGITTQITVEKWVVGAVVAAVWTENVKLIEIVLVLGTAGKILRERRLRLPLREVPDVPEVIVLVLLALDPDLDPDQGINIFVFLTCYFASSWHVNIM